MLATLRGFFVIDKFLKKKKKEEVSGLYVPFLLEVKKKKSAAIEYRFPFLRWSSVARPVTILSSGPVKKATTQQILGLLSKRGQVN